MVLKTHKGCDCTCFQTWSFPVVDNKQIRGFAVMKFCWCSILVKNMEESVRFYRDIAGLSIIRKLTA